MAFCCDIMCESHTRFFFFFHWGEERAWLYNTGIQTCQEVLQEFILTKPLQTTVVQREWGLQGKATSVQHLQMANWLDIPSPACTRILGALAVPNWIFAGHTQFSTGPIYSTITFMHAQQLSVQWTQSVVCSTSYNDWRILTLKLLQSFMLVQLDTCLVY